MDRRTLMLGAGVCFIGGGAYSLWRGGPSGMTGTATDLLLPQPANAQEATATAESTVAETAEATGPQVIEMVQGDPDAPVEVIEYASFTCPHCRSFHENVYPQFKADYVETGLVRFVYREVYFDRFGLWAGMVARCAGPLRYFGIVDEIYANQSEWTQGAPAEVAENLRRIGRLAGLDDEALDVCMTDADMAQAMIAAYEANQEEHDIRGTPSFVIDGTTHSNMSYAELQALLEDRIAAAE